MPYVDSVSLERVLPCLAEPGKLIVIGKPSRPLADVLPYRATLPGITAFNPEECRLTFRRQPGFLTLQRTAVYITQVQDVDEGLKLLAAVADSINGVWERRSELLAVRTRKGALGHLDIWVLLPRTNCGECGTRPATRTACKRVPRPEIGR